MMVWMWYDCITSVWWCDSFVCECCECIQIEEIAKKCKTKNRLKEPQKISLTFQFFCNISPNTATRGFPEDLWRLEKNVFSRDLVCLRVSRRRLRRQSAFCVLSFIRACVLSRGRRVSVLSRGGFFPRMFQTRNNILSIVCVVVTTVLLESANAISYTFEIAVENAHGSIGPVINRIKFDGEIPSGSDMTSYYTTNIREGDIKYMFDSSVKDGNYIAWNKPIPVGTQMLAVP